MIRAKKDPGLVYGYKSGLEETVAAQLYAQYGTVEYETMKIKFVQPEKNRSYRPDFVLPNGIIIETKGRFVLADRQKHLWIKEQYPNLDIRFIFTNPNAKLKKGAKQSYGEWCTAHGFKFATKLIPESWLNEGKLNE